MLTKIDDTNRAGYSYLSEQDQCYYWREYATGEGRSNPTNQLIYNLKKCPTRHTNPLEYRHKIRAIRTAANELNQHLRLDLNSYSSVAFVPIPPSKAKTDPKYDDRLIKVLEIAGQGTFNIIELLELKESGDTSASGNRKTPEARKLDYTINSVDMSQFSQIVLFDDVLTTGSHFVAAKQLISSVYDIPIIGLFIARTIHRAEDFDLI